MNKVTPAAKLANAAVATSPPVNYEHHWKADGGAHAKAPK